MDDFLNSISVNYNGATLYHNTGAFKMYTGSSFFNYNHFDDEIEPLSKTKTTPQLKKIQTNSEPKPRTYKLNKKVVSRKLMAFFHSKLCKQTLNFFTISFPLNTSDEEAFQLLNSVLTRLRRGYSTANIAKILKTRFWNNYSKNMKYHINNLIKNNNFHSLNHYLWVSERQGNGTIHFHLVTSDRIDVSIFNYFVAEYISNTLREKSSNEKIQNFIIDKYHGVDVSKSNKAIKNRSTLRKYLTKYISKNDTEFHRFCWHCSRSISALFTTMHFDLLDFDVKEFPLDLNYQSKYYHQSDYFTFVYYPDIPFDIVFQKMISINDKIIDIVSSLDNSPP